MYHHLMNILIVGAGAVGSVFGYHLQNGGAKISYLVKPNHLDSMKNGIQLYLKKTASKKSKSIRFTNYQVYSNAKEYASFHFDYVILTMPSNSLVGNWLPELLDLLGKKMVLVSLQPGMKDQEYILGLGKLGPDRLLIGSIPIVSYLAPLPGETITPPGYVSWTPPGQKVILQGPIEKAESLAAVFSHGEMPSKALNSMVQISIVPSIFLQILVASLESNEWCFKRLFRKGNLEITSKAISQAIPIAAAMSKIPNPMKIPIVWFFTKPFVIKFILKQAKWVVPFDFEAYMKVHFTKVGEQMHQGMKLLISEGEKFELPKETIEMLSRKSF